MLIFESNSCSTNSFSLAFFGEFCTSFGYLKVLLFWSIIPQNLSKYWFVLVLHNVELNDANHCLIVCYNERKFVVFQDNINVLVFRVYYQIGCVLVPFLLNLHWSSWLRDSPFRGSSERKKRWKTCCRLTVVAC